MLTRFVLVPFHNVVDPGTMQGVRGADPPNIVELCI